MPLLAYLLTWTTYGTWLRGDRRKSVIDERRYGRPYAERNDDLRRHDLDLLGSGRVILSDAQRSIVAEAITSVCDHRGWTMLAENVRTNHVHVVVHAPDPPENVLASLKAWSTRRLREAGHVSAGDRVWTKHGSTRYLFDARSVAGAVDYVVNRQGPRGEFQGPKRPAKEAGA